MNERSSTPTIDIVKRQKIASNPFSSTWVEANAGSGKTHVLVERVLRLLLEKVPPQNLLCLTYTNAAAAQMRNRVSKKLASWTLKTDDDLRDELAQLTQKSIDDDTLKVARTLFTKALETPGGLKINTIHAFCESVLHRFSLEAKVPLNFSVLEQSERDDLIKSAREQVFVQALQNEGGIVNSTKWLFANLSDHQIDEAINCAISNVAQLSEILRDKQGAKQRLKDLVSYKENDTVENLTKEIIEGSLFPPSNYVDVFAVSKPNKMQNRFEDKLSLIDIKNPDPDLVLKAFLKADFLVPARFPKKDFKEADGNLGERLLAEAKRLEQICERKKRAMLVARSFAFIDILGAIIKNFQTQKLNRSMLDFDDLIERTSYLFTNGADMDWVLYKLDANISHILVDESQDTNAQQWVIVKKLCEEFFAGETGDERSRTLFAVGDKKQSIFSFQGAEPTLFGESGVEIKLRAKNAKKSFNHVELKASFRTLPNILKAVDLVCEMQGISAALLADGHKIMHESARDDKGGSVTLWPVIKQQDISLPPDRWPLEEDALEVRNAARIVAQNIVNNIESWLITKRPLAQRGRAIKEDDILILVQSRKTLFHEIIRALKIKNIKTPGSDKISLSNHIVVLDLLALADILLNPHDDLTLAAVLRSPLFEFTEEDLFQLAHYRENNASLWSSLKNSSNKNAMLAFATLNEWRNRLDFDRPYEFFTQILYVKGGLKKFHARLGSEIDDILAEFLDLAFAHEQKNQPSLLGFINSMRSSDISITRELASSGNGVRIMTIHGAKGLEAPIVILADAATGPNTSKFGKNINFAKQPKGSTLIHASRADDFCENTKYLRQNDIDNEWAEYWRKLYVAMTRAEDELYVTGMLTKKSKIEGSWFHVIEQALSNDCETFDTEEGKDRGLIFPKVRPKPRAIKVQQKKIQEKILSFTPKLLVKHETQEIIRPSFAYENQNDIFDNSAQTIKGAELARKYGIALHALLEHLPKIAIKNQKEIAYKALEILLPNESELYDELVGEAIDILSNKKFKFLFDINSRAEVPFLLDAKKNEKKITIAGRIDRIIIDEENVLMVDFKSDAKIPKNESLILSTYLTQLGLYRLAGQKLFPNKKISAAIFWTKAQKLMRINSNNLEKAVAKFSLL